mmetsp:Transcript_10774/g.9322  ORF Transcript_10774/g.9322 Transcript_10774/m.9322 type:complete len:85 (-) Transcript_10774:236-490(-)
MNLKLENMLVGKHYMLKLTDFKRCASPKDDTIGRGTKNYRAPEQKVKACSNYFKVDIYSMGIILYVMKYRFFPYIEKPETVGSG